MKTSAAPGDRNWTGNMTDVLKQRQPHMSKGRVQRRQKHSATCLWTELSRDGRKRTSRTTDLLGKLTVAQVVKTLQAQGPLSRSQQPVGDRCVNTQRTNKQTNKQTNILSALSSLLRSPTKILYAFLISHVDVVCLPTYLHFTYAARSFMTRQAQSPSVTRLSNTQKLKNKAELRLRAQRVVL
jgi:hypothetical protein